ncbi:PREDICTED: uncharacterized protein LOC105568045 [Vollenhovia emeryi]|uniref:uncharacterized protein LOC105568045 n=1 Tax=Vollenhovia emeryi TaxID=411798 RepID=UPI0005F56963|nr:PREDICTED: uncharacterized protein LOC105568045 [Vollenhovia emeryi]
MKPITDAATTTASEDKVRKSLHELQPSAADKETLVGADRTIKSTQLGKETKSKKNIPTKMKKVSKKRKKVTNDKAVQTGPEENVEIRPEDLTCTDLANLSENYWRILAERRRVALSNVLEENKELSEHIQKLEEEKRIYKEMLNETRALVEVLQEMIAGDDDRNNINNSLEDTI